MGIEWCLLTLVINVKDWLQLLDRSLALLLTETGWF
jgi:hypothetical protein